MHMNSSYIPFVTHRVWCRPAVYGYNSFDSFRKAFPELKFMGVFILTEVHWWSQTLMLDEKAWLTVSVLIYARGALSGLSFVILSSVSSWTLVCALVLSHAGKRRAHLQTVHSKFWVMKYLETSCYAEALRVQRRVFHSLELKGWALLQNNPTP